MKFDARRLRRKEISSELASEFEEYVTAMTTVFDTEIQNYRSLDFMYDRESNEITTFGKDKNNVIRTETYYAPEYLKMARNYTKLKNRIDREREKLDIEAYELPELNELVERKSRGKSSKGLENITRTARRILGMESVSKSKDPVNMIERASKNREIHDRIKLESFDNADRILEEMGYNVSEYKKRNGEFRSKKKEREYLRLFSEVIVDEYEVYEGDFYGWVYEKSGGVSVKDMDAEEHSQYFKNYIIDTLETQHDKASKIEDEVALRIIESKLERIKNK